MRASSANLVPQIVRVRAEELFLFFFQSTHPCFWLMRRKIGDVLFRGVVGTLGLSMAGSLVWFGLTGINIVRETNRNLKAGRGDEREGADEAP